MSDNETKKQPLEEVELSTYISKSKKKKFGSLFFQTPRFNNEHGVDSSRASGGGVNGNGSNSADTGANRGVEPSLPTRVTVVNETNTASPLASAPSAPPAPALVYPSTEVYNVAPPSYQSAMSYPAAPTYNENVDSKYSVQPPTYHQPGITQVRLPQPDIAVNPPSRTIRVFNSGANVMVTIQPGQRCRRCNNGVVTRQTDMCCLLCLIILTIFTFPFGVVFLCCVPCTVQYRCASCRRSP